jgi:hypothetical protein
MALTGCAGPSAEPAPDDPEVKIRYATSSGLPMTTYVKVAGKLEPADGYTELWLFSKDGRYWIETRNLFKPKTGGCARFLDAQTAERVVTVWKRAAPLLDKIERESDPENSGIQDGLSYLFDGYSSADARGAMPVYRFDTIQEMIGGLYFYCRRKSWTTKQGIEKPLRTLEAIAFDTSGTKR